MNKNEWTCSVCGLGPDLSPPRRFSAPELARVGVEILNRHRLLLRCAVCGSVWSPNVRSGGRLPRGYWRCENGCADGTARCAMAALAELVAAMPEPWRTQLRQVIGPDLPQVSPQP